MSSKMRLIALAAVVAVLPALAAQDKDKPKAEKKENFANLPKITGKLVNPGGDKGNLMIRVEESYTEISGRRPVIRQRHKDFDLSPADEMIVRTNIAPIFYDNGKPRKPTSKELKEAKGDPNLPGYSSELSSLKRDQIVTAYVQPPKKTSGKKDDADALDSRPKVRMILIQKEP
ncbi:MAG TPA: hypothetical protein VKE94_01125 [Gemmataceae bacterium]|nr:hypothetical protein [Gemmataceae bacterium]